MTPPIESAQLSNVILQRLSGGQNSIKMLPMAGRSHPIPNPATKQKMQIMARFTENPTKMPAIIPMIIALRIV